MRRAAVRTAVVSLVVLGACELQPAPKQQPAPVVEAPARPPTPPPAVDDAGTADAIAPEIIQASPECINVAAHVVQVFIDTAKDPAQAAVYEQERMKMTRVTAEACQRQGWSEAAQKCYTAAKDPAGIKACENKFPPPPPPRMGSGAGSAVPTTEGTGAPSAGSAAPSAGPGAPSGAGSAAPTEGGQMRPEGQAKAGAVPFGPAPTDAQCKKLFTHVIDIEFKQAGAAATTAAQKAELAKQKTAVLAAKGAEFFETCKKMSRARVTCALLANDTASISKCDSLNAGPPPHGQNRPGAGSGAH